VASRVGRSAWAIASRNCTASTGQAARGFMTGCGSGGYASSRSLHLGS
jgi:hypothetical protein